MWTHATLEPDSMLSPERLPQYLDDFYRRERKRGRESGERKRDRSDIGKLGEESGTGPILVNWAAPPTFERSSPGRGILEKAGRVRYC